MSKNDFFAYKEKLKQCKPRFHFDARAKTGIENTWYRELKKQGKDRQEPPQKRGKIEKEANLHRKRYCLGEPEDGYNEALRLSSIRS